MIQKDSLSQYDLMEENLIKLAFGANDSEKKEYFKGKLQNYEALNTQNSQILQAIDKNFCEVNNVDELAKKLFLEFYNEQHIQKKIESTNNYIYREFLYKKLNELITIEEKRKNREFYLMLFYDDENTKREREMQLLRLVSSSIKISALDLDKKLRIIFKLNNQNSKI